MFTDIHNHVIFGVDDGASEKDISMRLIDMAYKSGTRVMCCTPHVYPEYFGDNAKAIIGNFEQLHEQVALTYPDMQLYLGSEIHYTSSCINWIRDGKGFTLNGTNNVLIEFAVNDSTEKIIKAISHLLNNGYRPIIAHPERYGSFCSEYREMAHMKNDGVMIQCDAGAFTGEFGFGQKSKGKALLKRGLVDIIASDAHSISGRNTDMSKCAAYVAGKFGDAYANSLFKSCPMHMLGLK